MALSWPQLRLTLDMRLPEAGPWNIRREAEILRFLGSFSPAERTAMAGEGAPIAMLSPGQQAALISEIRSKSEATLQDDIVRGRLSIDLDPKWQSEGSKRALVAVKSDRGETLWQTFVFYQALKK